MYRSCLYLLAFCVVCTSSVCEECAGFPKEPLNAFAVNFEAPQDRYAAGSTLWFSADFPAEVSSVAGVRQQSFTASPGGGLVAFELYRLGDSSRAVPVIETVEIDVDRGELQRDRGSATAPVRVLRYPCPERQCGFRVGFRPLEPGTYFLRANGGPVDALEEDITYCNLPLLAVERIVGGTRPDALAIEVPTELTDSPPRATRPQPGQPHRLRDRISSSP